MVSSNNPTPNLPVVGEFFFHLRIILSLNLNFLSLFFQTLLLNLLFIMSFMDNYIVCQLCFSFIFLMMAGIQLGCFSQTKP